MPVAKPLSARQPSAKYLNVNALTNVRSFIDTNILVYADSGDESKKQAVALALIRVLRANACGVLSTQVLSEYCNVALNKLRLPHTDIRHQLEFWKQFEVVNVTPDLIEIALDISQTRNASYYDSLIVAAAHTSGCSILYSEDINAGQVINGVKIVNPFV